MTRKESIEYLIKIVHSKRIIKLLNREWWREYFNEKKKEEK